VDFQRVVDDDAGLLGEILSQSVRNCRHKEIERQQSARPTPSHADGFQYET
jgi:hypothetical protein